MGTCDRQECRAWLLSSLVGLQLHAQQPHALSCAGIPGLPVIIRLLCAVSPCEERCHPAACIHPSLVPESYILASLASQSSSASYVKQRPPCTHGETCDKQVVKAGRTDCLRLVCDLLATEMRNINPHLKLAPSPSSPHNLSNMLGTSAVHHLRAGLTQHGQCCGKGREGREGEGRGPCQALPVAQCTASHMPRMF